MNRLEVTAFSGMNLQFIRFSILENFLPFLLTNLESNKENKCQIPLYPSFMRKGCYMCQDSVLEFTNYQCINFCLPSEENVGGVCVVRKNDGVHNQIKLVRTSNDKFRIELNRPIHWINENNFSQAFELR